jgi:predicted RNA-binding Zn-ribbon protein involved in translation (DUF1610 family)
MKSIRVYCEETQEWVDERKVKFVNIEEDFSGRDVLTFECPKCGKVHKSLRVG